jgi:hypothetical protein
MKAVLDKVKVLMPVPSRLNIFSPPIFLPIVSKIEKDVFINTKNQLLAILRLDKNLRLVSNDTAGYTTKVTMNTYRSAKRRP